MDGIPAALAQQDVGGGIAQHEVGPVVAIGVQFVRPEQGQVGDAVRHPDGIAGLDPADIVADGGVEQIGEVLDDQDLAAGNRGRPGSVTAGSGAIVQVQAAGVGSAPAPTMRTS